MPTVPRTFDEPAVTPQEIYLEADERLRISVEAMGENAKKGIEALEFEDGNQWPVDLANMRKIDRRPTLTINLTRSMVRRVCNNMRQQRPRIKVHPVGDGARIEDAKVVSGLIRHIETLSNASVAYDTGGESAVKIGWGYWRIIAEYVDEMSRDQELKIRAIRNAFTVYDDPTTQFPTGQDRDWLLISQEMQRQAYRKKYPQAKNAQWNKGGPGDVSRLWESKEKIRLAEYYRVHKTPEYLHYLNDGTQLFDKDYRRLREPLEAIGVKREEDHAGNPQGRMSHRREIQWFRLNGIEVVEKRTLPGRWIPVVRCLGNILDINGQVRMRGMIADLMDSNRMLNYWATCETEIVALAPRAPYIAAEGQLDGHTEWKDANQKPYSSLTYNIVHANPDDPNSPVLPPPQRTEAVQVPAGIVNARQSAKQDLMELAGMPHEPGRDTPGVVVSGKALRERQALSDIGHFQYYDNQTMAISFTGEILLDQIPHYYSTQRMQRIIGEDGVPQMVKINEKVMGPHPTDPTQQAIQEVKNNLTVGRFDVVMDTGPGYETKRQEGQEAVIDLLKTPLGEPIVKTGADIIVRNMDFAGADDLADRLLPTNEQGMQKAVQALPKEAQGIVMALQAQLKQAQGVIQQQAMEIKYKTNIEQGWMAVEREKSDKKATTDLHETSIDAQTKVFDTHVKSTTARDVAEIQAGAKLLDTHAQAGHDKAAAEIALKAAEKAEKSNGAA
jgi:portal protein